MVNKPTLLLILPWYCYPPLTGSLQRYYHLARWLARDFAVTLVAPPNQESLEAVDFLPPYEKLGIEVVPAVRDRRLRHRVRRKIKYTTKSLWHRLVPANPEVESRSNDDLHQATRCVAAGRRFDFTVLGTTFLADMIGVLPREQRGITVLDVQNVESSVWEQWWRGLPEGPKRQQVERGWKALVRFEKRWLPRQDAIVNCSPVDDEWTARETPGLPRAVVPNGIDCALYEPDPMGTEPESAAFIGWLACYTNDNAVQWFCREVLPAVLRDAPRFRFIAAGKDPTPAAQRLAGPNVEIQGTLARPQDLLKRAGIVVVPLLEGGGTRFKILEAFAAGKAVVSTSKGCEGLAVAHERDILIADDPAGFAAAVVRLLRDENLRRRLAATGRRLVEQVYDWRIVAGQFRGFLKGLKR
ncbi:MAG: glycosyltransferase family 4 protein [Verrucomicrobia bacterium]|nr:glycosyltransferase family 4 protein [Verrucomicrobiota bacterium]